MKTISFVFFFFIFACVGKTQVRTIPESNPHITSSIITPQIDDGQKTLLRKADAFAKEHGVGIVSVDGSGNVTTPQKTVSRTSESNFMTKEEIISKAKANGDQVSVISEGLIKISPKISHPDK